MRERAPATRAAIAVVLLAALYVFQAQLRRDSTPVVPPPRAVAPADAPPAGRGAADLHEAFRAKRSGARVEASGVVQRVLTDDSLGSQHQRFIVRVGDQTVLVAHNVDLAPRVPVAEGDTVRLSGEYEWNAQGGVIHWTHRDPEQKHAPGWIRLRDSLYQ